MGGLGTHRFNAARAHAQVWAGCKDGFQANDAERAESLSQSLRHLSEELAACRRMSSGSTTPSAALDKLLWGGSPATANLYLLLMKWHKDLEPIRNPAIVCLMPEADRKLAQELWTSVDDLYGKLNPPLDIRGLYKE